MKTKRVIQLFTKAVVPGQVKSRLIPALGVRQATYVYQQLLAHVVTVSCDSALGPVELWVADTPDHPSIRQWVETYPVTTFFQGSGDLGQRMLAALENGLARAHQVVVVGGDAYALDATYLAQAFSQLNQKDVVIGPAADGGYILIGCARSHERMFDGVAWGSALVLRQTLASLRHVGLTVGLLEPRWDIDTYEDILRYAPHLLD